MVKIDLLGNRAAHVTGKFRKPAAPCRAPGRQALKGRDIYELSSNSMVNSDIRSHPDQT